MSFFVGLDWKETVKLNSLRAFCAGLVIGTLILISGDKDLGVSLIFFMLLLYWLFFFPLGWLCAGLSKIGVPFAGLFSMFASLLVAVGDPVVFALGKAFPGLGISPDFGPFQLSLIVKVLREDASLVHTVE